MRRRFESDAMRIALLSVVFLSASWTSPAMQSDGVAETMVNVGEYSLFFKIWKGTGPVVLFESGGLMDSSEWDKITPILAKQTGATVISYDRAGFGKSDLPQTPYDIREESAALWRALEQLGFDKDVVLVGHSYAGLLIRLGASEHPGRIKGMVFVDPFSVEFVDAVGGPEVVDKYQQPLAIDTSHPEKLTKRQRAMLRFEANPLSDKVEAVRKTSYPQGIPVRIISSGTDWLPPETRQPWRRSHEAMAAAMNGARLVLAEGSDHMIPFRQPELVISCVVDVIRQGGGGRSTEP
jgi:pimeloyl-ACP methyl ester carboxylesterase